MRIIFACMFVILLCMFALDSLFTFVTCMAIIFLFINFIIQTIKEEAEAEEK